LSSPRQKTPIASSGYFLDVWQRPVVDAGAGSDDQGKGGKYYLYYAGNSDIKVPEGYFPVPLETYRGYLEILITQMEKPPERRAHMNPIWRITAIAFFITALPAGVAFAQDLVVYPAKGQSSEQTEKDKFECYSWAKGQTGFDPMQMPTASSPAPAKGDKSVAGGVVGGGVLGGVGGAVIGGIASGKSGAKKGAAIGGLSGGALGGMRSHSQNKKADEKREQWEKQQTSQYMQQRNAYNRNYAACLEGRGYSVK